MTDNNRSLSPITRVCSALQRLLTTEQFDQIFPLIGSAVRTDGDNDEAIARQEQEQTDSEEYMDIDDSQIQATILDTQRLEEIETDEAIARQLQEEEYSQNARASFRQPKRELNHKNMSRFMHNPFNPATLNDRALAEHLQKEENEKRKPFRRPAPTRPFLSNDPELIPIAFPARPSSANPSSNGNHHDIAAFFNVSVPRGRPTPGSRRPNDRGARNLQSTAEDFGPEHYESLLRLDDGVDKQILSKDQINNLPTEKFRHAAQPNDDENKCSICMEQFEQNETLRRLKCLHLYHKNCIDRWLPKSNLCPVCRIPQ